LAIRSISENSFWGCLQNLLKEYWQSSYFQELKNQIEMDMEYSAQLERMNIRDIPLRVIRNRDYELPTDNPFERSQASSVPSSGPLDPQGVNLGSRANGNSTSKSLDFKNIPPWESKAHESQSAYGNRLSKVKKCQHFHSHSTMLVMVFIFLMLVSQEDKRSHSFLL
jgi:hypothetical protein